MAKHETVVDNSLNPQIDPNTPSEDINIPKIDITLETLHSFFKKVTDYITVPKIFKGQLELIGICIQVLDNTASQQVVSPRSSNVAGIKNSSANSSRINLKKIRVWVPELDKRIRVRPVKIHNPDKDTNVLFEHYPIYEAADSDISVLPVRAGQPVRILYDINNRLSRKYLGPVDREMSISIFNVPGDQSASAKFFCEAKRTANKVISKKNALTNIGIVKTDAQPGAAESESVGLEAKYIQYLYEVERKYLHDLQKKWTPKTIIMACLSQDSIADPQFLWTMLYFLCGNMPVGLSTEGRIITSSSAVKDNYGCARITKKVFDSYKLELEAVEQSLEARIHRDLLDPAKSIEFLAKSFLLMVKTNKGSESDTVVKEMVDEKGNPSSDESMSAISLYFEELGIEISDSDFEKWPEIAKQIPSGGGDSGPTDIVFASFEGWMSGVDDSAKLAAASSETQKKGIDNDQGPDPKKSATPEDCHSNYPPENEYYIHVDRQKAKMRKYINSSLSGQKLQHLENIHKGIKNIRMAEIEISCPFKVIRFDGTGGYPRDTKRWFDASNLNGPDGLKEASVFLHPGEETIVAMPILKFKEKYNLGYYRQPDQIINCVVSTCGENDANWKHYYKNFCHKFLYSRRRFPHFIITPVGQIIQLVDAAATTNYAHESSWQLDSSSKTFLDEHSITIAFGDGVDENNPSITDNKVGYVTIKKQNVIDSGTRHHKIGTRAALESAHKLINFLTTKTNIKYNLAAQDTNIFKTSLNKANIYANGQITSSVDGMNFIYYAWAFGLAIKYGGKNIIFDDFI